MEFHVPNRTTPPLRRESLASLNQTTTPPLSKDTILRLNRAGQGGRPPAAPPPRRDTPPQD